MAYEFLKKLFGTPKEGEQPKAMTYDELEAAINAESGIKADTCPKTSSTIRKRS